MTTTKIKTKKKKYNNGGEVDNKPSTLLGMVNDFITSKKKLNEPIYEEKQANTDTTSVSNNYATSFKNLNEFISPFSRINDKYSGFNKTDSIAITPILNKLDTYVGNKKELTPIETKHIKSIVDIISNPITNTRYKRMLPDTPSLPKGRSYIKHNIQGHISKAVSENDVFNDMKNKVINMNDNDLSKILQEDYNNIKDKSLPMQVYKALSLKPSNVSIPELYKYAKYLETSPLQPMIKSGEREVNKLYYNKPKNKYALGGIDPISLGTSALSTGMAIYSAVEANAATHATNSFNKAQANKERQFIDSNMLESYNQSGVSKELYAAGGKFNLNQRTTGNISKFKPVAPNIFEVNGAKHSNGGVNVPGTNANVEGGELIKTNLDGTMSILSDQKKVLGYSPADKVMRNAKGGLASQIIEQMFNNEMAKQEIVKGGKNTTNKFDDGGYFNKYFSNQYNSVVPESGRNIPRNNPSIPLMLDSSITPISSTNNLNITPDKTNMLPYILDNVTNAITTLGTPKVNKPVLAPYSNINTDINVEPLVDNIKSNQTSTMRNINSNTGDSNVANALGIMVGNQATEGINSIRANEINQENQLKNQEVQMNQQTKLYNNQLINDYGETNVKRSLGINQAVNENINNLSRDLIDVQDKKAFAKQDNTRMLLMLSGDTAGSQSFNIANGSYDNLILSNKGNIDTTGWNPDNIRRLAERTRVLQSQQLK